MIVERLDPETTDDRFNCSLHLRRYHWAAQHVSGRHVLDIACGVGYGSAMLSGSGGAPSVLGVDRSPEAVAEATARHASDRVSFEVVEDAETVSFGERRFDTIVSLETLEHLPHPVGFLRRMHGLLAPGGRLIVSAPVRESPGDNPFHMHCFTPETLRSAVSEGFEIETELDQVSAYLTVVARRRETPSLAWLAPKNTAEAPRATVVLVTWNSLPQTVELVSAIRAFTKQPYDLLVVDNGSTDGTVSLLRLYQGEPGYRLVENKKNEKCAGATNRALELCRTEYVIYLCAKHALVTEAGWDEEVVRFLDERPEVGIAGHVWNPGFPLESRHYAKGWTPERFGIANLRHVQGGAFVARRKLFEEFGRFDADEYPQGGMDVEFCYRLQSHGQKLGEHPAVLCPPSPELPTLRPGVFVYHPATPELRREVRSRLAWKWVAPKTEEPEPFAGWQCVRGQAVPFPNGGFLVRGREPDSGLLSRGSFADVRISGAVEYRGRVVVKARIGSANDPGADGYHLLLGEGTNYLARAGHVLGRFTPPRGRCRFSLELEGSQIRVELGGERVLEVEDDLLREGHVLLGVNGGEALFSDVTIEGVPCPR